MNLQKGHDPEATPLDDAARAAWLYYVGGKTQDQIAKELGVSRQRAQRLVSKAVSDGLIHVRLEHKIAACLDLEAELASRYGLRLSRVAPSLGEGVDPMRSVAPAAAAEMERILSGADPIVMAVGTGRSLRSAIEEMRAMDCAQHKIVSLNGNISPDGSASFYDVIKLIADKVHAPHFPMPLPVIAASPEELEVLHSLDSVGRAMALARAADISFVGIGQMDETAPIYRDGFISDAELRRLQADGAVGELVGWPYDRTGAYLNGGNNLQTGVRVEPPGENLVVAVAAGPRKVPAIRGALAGALINGLITDEETAAALMSEGPAVG